MTSNGLGIETRPRKGRRRGRRAGRAQRVVIPAFEVSADDEIVLPPECVKSKLGAGREAPEVGVGIGEKATEGGEERLGGPLAVAQVRRHFVAADALRTTDRDLRAVALAPVIRRARLPRIGIDLGLGEGARQARALLIHSQLQIGPSVG